MTDTMEEFIAQCEATAAQKDVVDDIKAQLKDASGKLEAMKRDILKKMEAVELDKQQVPGVGTFSRVKKFSVKVPKDLELKERLFDYIKETKGDTVLLDLQSINSNTLNAFWKAEHEAAVDKGDLDWNLPGVSEPEVYYQLGIRKSN